MILRPAAIPRPALRPLAAPRRPLRTAPPGGASQAMARAGACQNPTGHVAHRGGAETAAVPKLSLTYKNSCSPNQFCGTPGRTRTCNPLLRRPRAGSAVAQIPKGRAKRVQLSGEFQRRTLPSLPRAWQPGGQCIVKWCEEVGAAGLVDRLWRKDHSSSVVSGRIHHGLHKVARMAAP